jgi:hypothetical protein
LVASEIAFLPAALIFRFCLMGAAADSAGSVLPLASAHRRFWASAIFLRDTAENFLRVPGVGVVAVQEPADLCYLTFDLFALSKETLQCGL